MMKRQAKELKMREILEENSLERLQKLTKANEKRREIKSKMEKVSKELELKSLKMYNMSVKNMMNDTIRSHRSNDRRENQSKFTVSSSYRKMDKEKSDDELISELTRIENKLKIGQERSSIYRQEISTKARQHSDKIETVKSKLAILNDPNERFSNYLQKLK